MMAWEKKTWNTKEGGAMDNWIGMTMAPAANHNHTSARGHDPFRFHPQSPKMSIVQDRI
jgi:hypothetical protein